MYEKKIYINTYLFYVLAKNYDVIKFGPIYLYAYSFEF